MLNIRCGSSPIKKSFGAMCAFTALVMPVTSHAILEMTMGDWDIQFSGNVNAFSTNISCDSDNDGDTIAGGLACGSGGDDSDKSNIQTGLLPSWLGFSASTTNADGFYTGFNISFQPGVDGGLGNDGALQNNSTNFRVVNFEFGNKETWGTLKLGRDLGVFASDAILNDMTLYGVGTVSDLASGGGNTTLGRIGVGYLYADWKAQIQYNSPNFNGFTFTAAIVDPWNAGGLTNGEADTVADDLSASNANSDQDGDTYGIEAKINYAFESGKVWASFITQDVEFNGGDLTTLTEDNPDVSGFDIGGKFDMGPVSLVGYYYDGEGIGTTGFLWDAFDRNGKERDSDGFYVQGMYTLPEVGTRLGLSYGESNLDANEFDRDTSLVKTNESIVAGIYHPVGHGLTLVAEYSKTEAEAHDGAEAEEDVISLGGIIFF